MKLEDKIYSKKELNAHYLKKYQSNEDQVIYTDNVGNQYHFIKVGKDLQFISMERNRVKIMRGFHN